MLFTDALISTTSDLVAYESDIEEIAGISGLDLETKLQRAQTEIGVDMMNAASAPNQGQAQFRLNQVVVTDGLKLWHTFLTLSLAYRDAYARKLHDKYLMKWNEYRALAKWARGLYFNIGAAVVRNPIPAPDAPELSLAEGGALPAETTYFVRVTWADANGVESAPSLAVSFTVPATQRLVVSVDAAGAPATAAGWVPYVGETSGEEQRQSAQPLAFDGDWTMPAGGPSPGAAPPSGQAADFFHLIAQNLQRG